MRLILSLLEGIPSDKYVKIKHKIDSSNKKSLMVYSIVACFIMCALGLFSLLTSDFLFGPSVYFTFVCAIIVNFIISRTAGSSNTYIVSLNCIFFILMMLVFGLLAGVSDGPDTTATVFVTFILAVPLIFTMRPFVIDLLTLFMTIVFLIADSRVKIHSAFVVDLTNVLSFAVVSIVISIFLMRTKLLKFVAEIENLELMEYIQAESARDGLTGLGNRKSYEMNFSKYQTIPKGRDFVYVSIDLNGLKVVNDTLGHAAGDEIIIGCAECMQKAFGGYGNLYRIGGDEYAAALFVNNSKFDELLNDFHQIVDSWSGSLVDSMSVAVGKASIEDYPDTPVDELSRIADKLMYTDKTRYYSLKGVDRRGRQEAHTVLCSLYTKILKIDLKNDSFLIVNVDDSERTEEMGYSEKISEWLKNFATMGNVHPDDVNSYLEQTSLSYLKEYFDSGKTSIHIFYRRKIHGEYKQVMMEMIPLDTYSEHNQCLFLYVKNIDK